jgi:hypothetical protein
MGGGQPGLRRRGLSGLILYDQGTKDNASGSCSQRTSTAGWRSASPSGSGVAGRSSWPSSRRRCPSSRRRTADAGRRAAAAYVRRSAGLVAGSRRAGLPVDLYVDAPGNLPDHVGRMAYRIVQEGLTNALKHAPCAPVRVRVVGAPGDGLSVELRNPAPEAATGDRQGLIGLTERAALVDGRLEHGRAGDDARRRRTGADRPAVPRRGADGHPDARGRRVDRDRGRPVQAGGRLRPQGHAAGGDRGVRIRSSPVTSSGGPRRRWRGGIPRWGYGGSRGLQPRGGRTGPATSRG